MTPMDQASTAGPYPAFGSLLRMTSAREGRSARVGEKEKEGGPGARYVGVPHIVRSLVCEGSPA